MAFNDGLFTKAGVSIHAPVMDANRSWVSTKGFLSFNPRARDGREASSVALASCQFVSIHAPVMDANAS